MSSGVVPHWSAARIALCTHSEQPCTGLGARGDLLHAGRLALAKHRCPLRLHRIVDFKQPAIALVGKPVGEALPVRGIAFSQKDWAISENRLPSPSTSLLMAMTPSASVRLA